jgi:hypothetical protein
MNSSITDTLIRFQAIEENWPMHNYIFDTTKTISHQDSWSLVDPNAPAIFEWCDKNCKSKWVQFGGKFYFKEEKDLTWFLMRWSSSCE